MLINKQGKKGYKIQRNFGFVAINTILVLTVLMLSIGWSVFSQSLKIQKFAFNVRVEKDIRVTGVNVDGVTNGGLSYSEDYNVSNISSNLTLPNAESTVRFKVQVTNVGNVEMGIFTITGLPNNLEYTLDDYNLQEKICVNGSCQLGIQKEFYITIKYKDGGFDASQSTYYVFMDFDFRPFHTITYSGFKNSTTSYPQEIIDGGNLKVTFTESLNSNNLEVLLSGKKTDFTFDNNVLELNDVKEDVQINYKNISFGGLYLLLKNANKGSDKDINFKEPATLETSGIYMHEETKDDPYPVYYYRGIIDNNSVLYAGHCWLIVRTTETGGIKLVYDGKPSGNTCHHDHTYLGTESYNGNKSINASPSEVGYMYGDVIGFENLNESVQAGFVYGNDVNWDSNTKEYTLVTTYTNTNLDDLEDGIRGGRYGTAYHYTCLSTTDHCQTVYYIYYNTYGSEAEKGGLFSLPLNNGLNIEQALAKLTYDSSNSTSSLAKGSASITGDYIDSWFANKSNISANVLDDVIWCNDRSIYNYGGWDKDTDNHTYDNKYLLFGAHGRLVDSETGRPSLVCPNKNDSFTVSNENGNTKLTYPIAMLTADEAVMAGAVYDVVTDYYLNTAKTQYFLSPFYFSDDNARMFVSHTGEDLNSGYTYNGYGIRPAIALKPIFKIVSGDGTGNNPYIIEEE